MVSGSVPRDLIDMGGAARITLDALEKGSHRIYNAGTGSTTRYGAIAAMIGKNHVIYVRNPFRSYQYYTRADMNRLGQLGGGVHAATPGGRNRVDEPPARKWRADVGVGAAGDSRD